MIPGLGRPGFGRDEIYPDGGMPIADPPPIDGPKISNDSCGQIHTLSGLMEVFDGV
jgi:hypothetical protein